MISHLYRQADWARRPTASPPRDCPYNMLIVTPHPWHVAALRGQHPLRLRWIIPDRTVRPWPPDGINSATGSTTSSPATAPAHQLTLASSRRANDLPRNGSGMSTYSHGGSQRAVRPESSHVSR